MSWTTRKLGNCVIFQSGGTPNKGNPDFWGGDIPWVSSAEMKDRFLRDTSLKITQAGLDAGSRIVPKGTTFAVVRGMSLAKEFRISLAKRPMAFNQDVKALIAKDGFDGEFIFYTLAAHANAIRDLATEAAHGTKKLDMDRLESYFIMVPDIKTQKKVASIIYSYDDLIATNQRRIALLEDAARLLYREWFVHLRFPGHELVPVRDGVPQGWEKVAIGSLIDFHIGGGWGKDADDSEASDAAFVIRGTDIPRIKAGLLATVPLRYHPAKGLASRKLQPGDLVFEVSGGSRDQGVCRLLPISSTLLERFQSAVMCASFCKLIRPRVGSSEYIGFTLDYLRLTGVLRTYENQSASNIVNFGFSDFCDKHLIFKVPGRLLESFREFLAPLLEQCDQIAASQEKIIQARDLLLPKLMSGQLDVSTIPLPDEVPA